MDSRIGATIGIGLVTAVLAGFSAYGDIRAGGASADHEAAGSVVLRDSAPARDTTSLAAPRWLSDANILALVGVMNAREIAAANVELGAWHSDSVRAIAAATAHEHEVMQHAADSLAAVIRIAPVAPALAAVLDTALKGGVDSLGAFRGAALDRAFLQQQASSHSLMASYLNGMTDIAQRPEIQTLLGSLSSQAAQQAARAQTLELTLVRADSAAAADSAARSARHDGTRTNR